MRFRAQVDVIAENGSLSRLADLLAAEGFERHAFLVDAGFAKSDLWTTIKSKVTANASFVTHYDVGREPTYDDLRSILSRFPSHEGVDVVVGIGGGSCMDTAKAVAALLTNAGDPLDYRGFDQLSRPGVPAVLVPTTAGTGSEVSFNASFVDTESSRKMGINGKHMFPALAVLDGEAVASCPRLPAIGAGVDALVHAFEGFTCKQATPWTDMMAASAIGDLCSKLPLLASEKASSADYLDMLRAAALGGLIQMNSGSGVAAAISYPLSVYYQVPHGFGGGMFLVPVARHNLERGFHKYAQLAGMLDLGGEGDVRDLAGRVVEHIGSLMQSLSVPTSLSTFGISPESRQEVLSAMSTQQPGFDQNPIPFTVEDDLETFLNPFLT